MLVEQNLHPLQPDMVATRRSSTPPSDLKPWVNVMVRVGFAAKGLIYALIGILAFRLAFGLGGGQLTDASGVLRTLLRQPFGLIMLTIIGVGILVYAGWQVFEALADTRRRGGGVRGWLHRSLAIIKGVAYGTVGWEAMRIVFGDREQAPEAEDHARTVMRFPLGDVFLALVGLGVALYGATQIKMAWDRRFDDDVDQARIEREVPWLLRLGRAGIGARGVVLMLMGFALTRAGFAHRPDQAGGYRDSLVTIFIQPYGSWLLGAVAVGLTCFGIFQLLHARYARF